MSIFTGFSKVIRIATCMLTKHKANKFFGSTKVNVKIAFHIFIMHLLLVLWQKRC